MCRLLAITAAAPFSVGDHLRQFARIAQTSREYQGHGWGCAWFETDGWRTYHTILPIWQDDLTVFGRTRVLVAHVRSAFRDEGIVVENNMPFLQAPFAFVFNGELRGVRMAGQGRTGAEKLFRFLIRSGGAADAWALRRSMEIVAGRSRYVRAMNLVIARPGRFLIGTTFSEDEDYFTMHRRERDGLRLLCSRPYEGESDWQPIPNHTVEETPWFS